MQPYIARLLQFEYSNTGLAHRTQTTERRYTRVLSREVEAVAIVGDMNVADTSPVAIALRTLAAAAGLRSLHHLAQAASVDKGTLRFALRGDRVPCDATVARLAIALRVEPAVVREMFDGVRSR